MSAVKTAWHSSLLKPVLKLSFKHLSWNFPCQVSVLGRRLKNDSESKIRRKYAVVTV